MRYKVFGCKVNKYYTDKWLHSAQLSGKEGIFIASCVVTDKAKKKWVRFVRQQIPLLKFGEKIFLSGCGAFEKGTKNVSFFETYPELSEWKDRIEILPEDPDESAKNISHPMLSRDKKSFVSTGQTFYLPNKLLTTKKFVLIQGGCDSFCTFCLTVQKRGRHFSRSKEEILEEILTFERGGGKEVVLTGVNLCAWGADSTNTIETSRFAELLEYLLKNSEISRIRISSLGPEFINDNLLKIFETPRICPHFHLSIQSGSGNILKAMKRHYDDVYLKNLLGKMRKIHRKDGVKISIGADIIVGFPGETEADFMDTYHLVTDFQITKLHTFPFSAHKYGESVPAGFYVEQVDDKTKEDRLERLLRLGDEVRRDFIESQIGEVFEVLIEFVKDDHWKGWTQNYIGANEINFEIISGHVARNEIVKGRLKGIAEEKESGDFGV